MGFASGFQAGTNFFSTMMADERARAKEGREADAYGRARQREDEVDTAIKEHKQLLASGLQPEMVGNIKQTYGMNDDQIAAAGPGLKAKLAGYDAPDSYDMQGAPAPTGTAPANAAPAAGLQKFSADRVPDGARALGRSEVERSYGNIAAAQRNVAGMRESQNALRKIEYDDTVADIMKMPMSKINAELPSLNTNDSKLPVLYLGKEKTKRGYTELKLIDPETGIPADKVHKMNDTQVRQLYLSSALAKKGFGTESMELLKNVDKEFAEHVGKWNAANTTVANSQNIVNAHENTDKIAEARLAVAKKAADNAEKRAAAGDHNPMDISEDGKFIHTWNTRDNAPGRVAVPPGVDPKVMFSAMMRAQNPGGRGGGGGKDTEAPAPGTTMTRSDGTRYKDGGADSATGKRIELGIKAVMPEDRTSTLIKGGVPDKFAEELEWSAEGPVAGQHVRYNGKWYSATRPNDPGIEDLIKAYKKDEKEFKVHDEWGRRYWNDRNEYEKPLAVRRAEQSEREEEIVRGANPMFN